MSSSEALTMKPFLGAVTTTVLLLAWIVFMAGSSTAEKVNRLPRQSGGGMNKPEFTWNCFSKPKGYTYKPTKNTTCVCVEIFSATCGPDMIPTTTTLSPSPNPTSTSTVGTAMTTTTPNSSSQGTTTTTTTDGGVTMVTSTGTTCGPSSSSSPGGTNTTTDMTTMMTTAFTSMTTPTDSPSTPPPVVIVDAPHPLDPLSPSEITSTRDIILTYIQNNQNLQQLRSSPYFRQSQQQYIFNYITLQEPPKSVLLPYFLSNTPPPPDVTPRRSFAILISRSDSRVFEVTVNLSENRVEKWEEVTDPNSNPSLSPEDLNDSEAIARANPEVQRRCAALGYPNMSLVNADPWTIGYIGDRRRMMDPAFQGRRLIQLYLYGKNSATDNQYAHPFDFLVVVDMTQRVVTAIEELPTHANEFDMGRNKQGNTVPREEANYDYNLRSQNFLRTDDKPITTSSPEGVSYSLQGNLIQWQKFNVRVGFNGREGLVLYNVNYNDSGTVRPVLYRASLSEMFIPYGDPRPPYHRKAVFDLGEYGIGFNANKLKPNEDCIGQAVYLNETLNNSTGDAVDYPNAICIREEDAGILWKHVDYRNGRAVVVRSHRLVISFIATVGNYEYVFLWQFYQDGSIQLNIQLTGILSINLLAVGSAAGDYGTMEAPQIYAPYHQHFFSVRLDMEVDGNNNSVYTTEAVPVDAPTGSEMNPYGQGFTTKRTPLRTQGEGRTNFSAETGKVWAISNPSKMHPYTRQPVAWKLMPVNSPGLKMKKDSPLRPKAAFLDYDVWVTKYEEGQLFAGGYYLNADGLNEWVGNDTEASIEDKDIVLWHNFGLTHIPRVEDYPVMPVESTGFWLKPYNFFLENPGLDVPPPSASSGGRKKKQEL